MNYPYLNLDRLSRHGWDFIRYTPDAPGVVLFFDRTSRLLTARAEPSVRRLMAEINSNHSHHLRDKFSTFSFVNHASVNDAEDHADWINEHCAPIARSKTSRAW